MRCADGCYFALVGGSHTGWCETLDVRFRGRHAGSRFPVGCDRFPVARVLRAAVSCHIVRKIEPDKLADSLASGHCFALGNCVRRAWMGPVVREGRRPLRACTGLGIVPGSHIFGVLSDDAVLDYVSHNEPVGCLTPRGGVIAMRPLLIHSSSKARSEDPGRVLHIEYADSLDLRPPIRLAVA
jgi:hypothetical protein